MFRTERVLAVVCALAFAGAVTASNAEAQTTAPCAPVIKPPTDKPAPPTNLHIIKDILFEPDVHGPHVVEPANDGAPVALQSTGPHAYFDALSLRSDCLVAYSLRDQTQLEYYREKGGEPPEVNYLWPYDTDPRKQDAARIVIAADKVKLTNQVRLPIPDVTNGFMLTWDAWFGKEFRYENTLIEKYKTFQFASPYDQVHTEIRNRFERAKSLPTTTAVSLIDVRCYSAVGSTYLGSNVSDNDPLSPQLADFVVAPETWTRYWALFKPNGAWFEFSLWAADVNHDAVKLIDRLLMKPTSPNGWSRFWFEYNTSSYGVPAGRGPLVSYVRNVVILANAAADMPTLLQRPIK